MLPSTSPPEWRDWLALHAAKLLVYARQQTRCEADAEDVLQDALVEAWERCRGEAPPLALVFATIRRRAIDRVRSAERRVVREQAGEPASWFEPEIESRDTHRQLEEAVKNLSSAHREVVTLKTWGGLTFQEIADTIGVPLATAASRYRAALEELRGSMKEVRR